MATETVRTELRHHVRAEHASTGRPLAPLDARLDAAPPGWYLVVKGADVIVGAPGDAPEPEEPPVAHLTLSDPVAALRVQAPAVDIELDAPELVHAFVPVPMTLTVELVVKGDENGSGGGPVDGADLQATGTDGDPVPLPAVAGESGLYRSAPHVWTSDFDPFDLERGGDKIARLAIDFSRTDTRVRVVDPT